MGLIRIGKISWVVTDVRSSVILMIVCLLSPVGSQDNNRIEALDTTLVTHKQR